MWHRAFCWALKNNDRFSVFFNLQPRVQQPQCKAVLPSTQASSSGVSLGDMTQFPLHSV